ncbi:prepilin peptidase [Ponticaulis sp.]|uniref:A24 family peptidase n=1 Tax=Ponticaulis sp. TaxID=2020902 RepID=UPI000B63074E|nr:prepilin peptidase [Ponticaulis sp.]MAI91115.1 hypothetical protein [Ponticaulis sp.]OUX98435.1 MAG: hypothetical protein CBB65_11760 [Hyphomonadaceae bacterium TMED5]|tara:strand:- start:23673 stop:24200 length:528 start_codon:yes stop_codon:yes gene_type:complete
MLFSLLILLFCAGLVFAAFHDIASMTIPNWLSVAYIVSFPVAALFMGASLQSIGWHFAAGGIALVICFGLFAAGVFGGGDAKLIPAVMVWVGPDGALAFVFALALSGGLLALLFILSRRFVPATVVPGFLHRSVVEGPGIPYAVAIAFGGFWAIPASPFLCELLLFTNFSSLTMP